MLVFDVKTLEFVLFQKTIIATYFLKITDFMKFHDFVKLLKHVVAYRIC